MAAEELKPEEYEKRRVTLEGWEINITSYRLGAKHYCHVDNVSPGATVARGEGATRAAAEDDALRKARERLGKTRRVSG